MASLFDTGVFERMRRHDRVVEEIAVRLYPPLICTHVAAEMIYGWMWTRASDEKMRAGRAFIDSFELLTPTLATATIYARLRSDARRGGRDMPDPDFWIAAHAIENDLPLVSLDKHFTVFDELNLHLLS